MSILKKAVVFTILTLNIFSINSFASQKQTLAEKDNKFIDALIQCPVELEELNGLPSLQLSKAKLEGGMTTDLDAISITYTFEFAQIFPAPSFDKIHWILNVTKKTKSNPNSAPDAPGRIATYSCKLRSLK